MALFLQGSMLNKPSHWLFKDSSHIRRERERAMNLLAAITTSLALGTALCDQLTECSANHSCPLWTMPNSSRGECECGSSVKGLVHCRTEPEPQVSVRQCYCLTYSQHLHQVLLSYCFYTCNNTKLYHQEVYRPLPLGLANASSLNTHTCSPSNRTGLMCGQCLPGYAPSVYSYDLSCVPCAKSYWYNWLKYVAIAYVPLTAFYVLIVTLRVSVTSAPMVVYVAMSQLIAAPELMRYYYVGYGRRGHRMLVDVFSSLYAVWNLDFFRALYHPFCLHPDFTQLHVVCLDYLVGVYPLLLIFLTYHLVRLHDRYVVLSRLWKPCHRACSLLRRRWDLRESLVKAFATFLVLSYVKTMNTSFTLLAKAGAYYDVCGRTLNQSYLFINGSLLYFSKEHIPYAVIAMFMLLVFNVAPLLLLWLYPVSWFQRCLNMVGCRCQGLHVLMDTLQGCYHERPRDCRYFAGLYMLLRCVNLALFSLSYSPHMYCYASCVYVLMIILLATFRPYKNPRHNALDIVLFSLAVLLHMVPAMFVQFHAGYFHTTEKLLWFLSFLLVSVRGVSDAVSGGEVWLEAGGRVSPCQTAGLRSGR